MPEPRLFKQRPYGNMRRLVNTREVRQSFLIVCEGEKTEPNYFRSFRISKISVKIDVIGKGDDPQNLVQRAMDILHANKGAYDQAWCVFDRDSFSAQRFNLAINMADRNRIHVAYSNEAFELWYRLHYDYVNTAIGRSRYIEMLTKSLGHKYEKNSETMYAELEDRQPIAIKHAELLLAQYPTPRPERDNPSTTVHLLVKELNRFAAG